MQAELRDRNTDLAVRPVPEPITDESLTLEISFRWLHRGPAGIQEHILGVDAVSALLAAGVQGASAPALRLAASRGAKEFIPSRRLAFSQRIAAGFLAITVASMAAARYALTEPVLG